MNTTSRGTRAALVGLTLAIGFVPAMANTTASAHGGADPGHAETSHLSGAQRSVIREATRQYRDVDAAIADGYVPTDNCSELPGVDGMGYHYVNPGLAGDGRIDPTIPEILVYYKARNGKLRLGAIEYFQADADQDLGTDGDRPTLMGHPFEGPMPGHEPGMPVHYDLHVWLYKHNPAGELATWNPDVRCPTD